MGCLGVVAAIFVAHLALAEAKAGECVTVCDPCAEVSCDPCAATCSDFDTSCDPCDKICDLSLQCDPCGPELFGCKPKKSLWFLSGHMEAGLFTNEYGRTNMYSPAWNDMGPAPWSGNTELLKNVHNSDAQLNQALINFGKKLSKRGWDVGGQVTAMWGTDARFAQSAGMEYNAGHGTWNDGDYYTAVAQAFVEIGYNNVSVKAGKFWNPMGANPLDSTERFFYTLSDAFGLMPVTQSGILATWDVNKKLSVFGGWTSGTGDNYYGISEGDMFFDSSDNNAFLGGARYTFSKRLSLAYTALIGKDDRYNWDRDYFVQSFIVGYKPGKRWDYTFEWTLRNEKDDWDDHWGGYGINNELVYRINKRWAIGGRVEWIRYYGYDDGEDKYAFSIGANWTPRSWIVVRPELRYDKFETARPFYSKGYDKDNKDQLSGGFSAIVKF